MKKRLAAIFFLITFILIIVDIIVLAVSCGKGSAPSQNPETVAVETTAAVEEIDYSHPPASVSVGDAIPVLGLGESARLTASYDGSRPASGAEYSSDKPEVLSVDPANGLMTAKAEGYATVTVTSFNGLTDKSYVTVKKAPTAVRFQSASMPMLTGEQMTLRLDPASVYEGLYSAEYTSDNSGVASVTADGIVTAASKGSAVITAKAYNGMSASVTLNVTDDSALTEQSTTAGTVMLSGCGWDFSDVADVPAGSTVYKYGESSDGRWVKVKYNDLTGWIYNKALGAGDNATDYTEEQLPVLADDLIFDIGKDKRAIFDFVYSISYDERGDNTVEGLALEYFMYRRGSCYHHAGMLCYLYNRCGWETVRLVGKSAYDGVSDHSWCMCKTEDGWRHVDAQYFSIREADEQYFITDDIYDGWFHWDYDSFPSAVDDSKGAGQ